MYDRRTKIPRNKYFYLLGKICSFDKTIFILTSFSSEPSLIEHKVAPSNGWQAKTADWEVKNGRNNHKAHKNPLSSDLFNKHAGISKSNIQILLVFKPNIKNNFQTSKSKSKKWFSISKKNKNFHFITLWSNGQPQDLDKGQIDGFRFGSTFLRDFYFTFSTILRNNLDF